MSISNYANNFANIPSLRLMNLRIKDSAMEYRSYKAFGTRCVHMNQRVPDGPPETWASHYPENVRTVLRTGAETRDQALMLSDILSDI